MRWRNKKHGHWRDMWRDARKAHERAGFSIEMRRVHGAPEDCELAPFDCVMLEQSIRSAGNEPPRWIISASRQWLVANGYTPNDLRPVPQDSRQESSTTQQPVGASCARPDTTPQVAAMAQWGLHVARADDETKPHSPAATVTE